MTNACFGIIYKATNKINGKVYIGQTVCTLTKRKNSHFSDAKNNSYNSIFHKALLKYGKNNFIWEIIECCNSKEELDEMEFHYIKRYNSFGDGGYNLTLGGDGMLGLIKSATTRKKISKSLKGRFIGVDNPNYGKSLTYEHRIRLSKSKIGKYLGSNCYNSKKYIVYFPSGECFMVHGLSYFCRKLSLSQGSLSAVAIGKRNHHKGYKCEYYDPIKHKDIKEFDSSNY